jgi:hypothetical protein
MTVTMTDLGFVPKGRFTIRRGTPSNRLPRYIEPWALQPKAGTTLAKIERAYLDALEAVDSVEARKAAAIASKKFTAEGVANDVLKFAASQLAPKLKRARQTIEAARSELAAKREKLTLKRADPADAAGQARRLWKLDKFNALLDRERNALTADAAALDPELVQVFLEMPGYAKVLSSDLDQIRERALRAQHGDEAFAEVAELADGIKIADDIIVAARQEIGFDVGGLARLNEAAAPFEKAATAPWLKKFTENGVEVVRRFKIVDNTVGGGRWTPATPQELEDGVFFANAGEYERAQRGEFTFVPKENQNGNASA